MPEGERLDRIAELARMFDRIPNGYEARPDYPGRVFDVLVERCGLRPGCRVVEIGPGSGQATLPMLDRGADITAVEPGAALAARLAERTAGQTIDIVVTNFEGVHLPEASFDIAASATAFHWVDSAVGLDKCADALRDGGWLALWWTFWGDPDRPDPLHDALHPILQVKAPHMATDGAGSQAHISDVAARAAEVDRHPAYGPVDTETIYWEGDHDPPTIRRIFATFSGWVALPEPLRAELLDDVERLARDDFGGTVHRPYRTVLYTARRLAR